MKNIYIVRHKDDESERKILKNQSKSFYHISQVICSYKPAWFLSCFEMCMLCGGPWLDS